MAESMGVEGMARSRKQDIIFGILKAHSRHGENIYGDGVLEILQDGFGFLRSSDGSLSRRSGRHLRVAQPDPPLQPAHRRHHLGPHPPAERWRALLRVAQGRRDQFRFARFVAQQGAVREPDAVPSHQAAQAAAGQWFDRRSHRTRHRPGLAHRQGPARSHRLAAESRQDHAAAEHRHRPSRRTIPKCTSSCCSSTSARKK